jgi:hypothetical protein
MRLSSCWLLWFVARVTASESRPEQAGYVLIDGYDCSLNKLDYRLCSTTRTILPTLSATCDTVPATSSQHITTWGEITIGYPEDLASKQSKMATMFARCDAEPNCVAVNGEGVGPISYYMQLVGTLQMGPAGNRACYVKDGFLPNPNPPSPPTPSPPPPSPSPPPPSPSPPPPSPSPPPPTDSIIVSWTVIGVSFGVIGLGILYCVVSQFKISKPSPRDVQQVAVTTPSATEGV